MRELCGGGGGREPALGQGDRGLDRARLRARAGGAAAAFPGRFRLSVVRAVGGATRPGSVHACAGGSSDGRELSVYRLAVSAFAVWAVVHARLLRDRAAGFGGRALGAEGRRGGLVLGRYRASGAGGASHGSLGAGGGGVRGAQSGAVGAGGGGRAQRHFGVAHLGGSACGGRRAGRACGDGSAGGRGSVWEGWVLPVALGGGADGRGRGREGLGWACASFYGPRPGGLAGAGSGRGRGGGGAGGVGAGCGARLRGARVWLRGRAGRATAVDRYA